MAGKRIKIEISGRYKHNSKVVGSFLAVAALVLAAAAIYYAMRGESGAEGKGETAQVLVYFPNAVTLTWEAEARKINVGAEDDMVAETFAQWLAGPKSNLLTAAVPSGMVFDDDIKFYTGGTVETTFNKEMYEALSAEQAAICNASLVYTLTSLDFVNDVRIYVGEMALIKDNGSAVGLLSRDSVIMSGDKMAGEETSQRAFTIYFAGADGRHLRGVAREVSVDPNLPIEKYIVEQILNGPEEEGCYAVVSADVKLNSVKTEEGGKCYVDFSEDFTKKFEGGSAAEAMMVYSIVDSLTELSSVKEVQFLINGEVIIDSNKFEMDLSKPISRNEDIIEAND